MGTLGVSLITEEQFDFEDTLAEETHHEKVERLNGRWFEQASVQTKRTEVARKHGSEQDWKHLNHLNF